MKLQDRRTLLRGLVPALLFAATLATPGLGRIPIGLLGLLAVSGAAVLLFSIRSFARLPLVCWFGLAACGATALQLVPLPAALVATIAPYTFELVADSQRVLGETMPAFLPLSADPHSTAADLGKLIALAAIAVLVARLAASQGSRIYLLKSVAAVGLFCGACAVGHYLAAEPRLFGLYSPKTTAPLAFLSPLVNPNHLSALMVVTACLSTALATRAASSQARVGWALSGGFAVTLCLLLRSRAAVLLLGVSAVALAALLLRRQLKRSRGSRSLFAGLFVAGCFLSMIAALTGDELAHEFVARPIGSELHAQEGRIELWRAGWELVAEQPLAGIGRGAFESTMARHYDASHLLTYSFVENEYLEALIAWGVPLGLGLGALYLWMVARALRRGADDSLAGGAAVALFALVVHALADFGLETPGLATCAIVLLCVLDRPVLAKVPPSRWRKPLWAGALIAVTSILFLARPLREDRAALAATPDESLARAAMGRHPADFLAPAVVASRRIEAGDPHGFAFANHALLRQPSNPHMHHLVARTLHRLGRTQQACIEYRLAAEGSPSFAAVMEDVVARYRSPQAIADCLPLTARPPVNPVTALAGIGQGPAARLLLMRTAASGRPVDRLVFAELESAHGDAGLAVKTIRDLVPTLVGYELVRAARIVRDPAEALALYDRALATLIEPRSRAQIYRARAALLRVQGHPHQAAWEEARAKELSP